MVSRLAMTAHGSIDSRRTDPQVLSISSGGNLVVSVTAVLGAIHHAAGPLASSKLPRKPTSGDMRNAAGIALSISELVRESEVHAREALWTVEVPEDPADLSRRAGASLNETEDAVRLLVAAEVVSRVGLTEGARLRVGEAMFAEEPVLAQVAWEGVRERLATVRASVTPALAVVREVARSARLAEAREGSSWASLTLARFVERTLFQRTAVSRAISALQEAGVIERGQPRGLEGQYRLLPAAFGFAREPFDDDSGVPVPSDRPTGATEVAVSPPRAPTAPVVPPSTPAVGPGPRVHVGGIPVEVPPGVSLRVELDAEGRQYVHIGPHVVIGPL